MKFFDTHGLLYKKKDVYFKHSSGEQFTGRYWIDGKKIYTKTLIITLSGEQNQSFNHGLSMGSFRAIDIAHSAFKTNEKDNMEFPIGSFYDTASYATIYGLYDTNIGVKIGSNWASAFNGGKLYLTVNYTKSNE